MADAQQPPEGGVAVETTTTSDVLSSEPSTCDDTDCSKCDQTTATSTTTAATIITDLVSTMTTALDELLVSALGDTDDEDDEQLATAIALDERDDLLTAIAADDADDAVDMANLTTASSITLITAASSDDGSQLSDVDTGEENCTYIFYLSASFCFQHIGIMRHPTIRIARFRSQTFQWRTPPLSTCLVSILFLFFSDIFFCLHFLADMKVLTVEEVGRADTPAPKSPPRAQ